MPNHLQGAPRRQLRRSVVLLSVLLLSTATTTTNAQSCSPSNCEHGTCSDGKCKCLPNYLGPDCSVPFVTCPDGDRTCMNGSVCVRNNEIDPITGKYKYHCDCSAAFDVNVFAGHQCEHAATTICEAGTSLSSYAFCTNGGTCVNTVLTGGPHEGCECPAEFEGQHCQYLIGTAPDSEIFNPYAETYDGSSRRVSRIAAFFISFSVVIVVGLSGLLIWKRHAAGIDSQFEDKTFESDATPTDMAKEETERNVPAII